MTVPELIDSILNRLRNQLYCDLSPHDFQRDRPFLINAIGTYGHECRQRGWEFDVPFLYRELCQLLMSFKRYNVEIKYVPLYLQRAIKRHIGQRAEELKAAALTIGPKIQKITRGLTVVEAVREPSPVELLAAVYGDITKLRKRAAAERRAGRTDSDRQKTLL